VRKRIPGENPLLDRLTVSRRQSASSKSYRREQPSLHEQGTQPATMGQVHAQHGYRSPASWRLADNPRPFPCEMPNPFLPARIEKLDDFSGLRIQTAQIASFEKIAQLAGPGEIMRCVGSAVFPGDYMFQVERLARKIGFVKATVLAAVARSLRDH
jgi:hypothetical protein